jgi:hypothetical protein
MRHLTRTRCAAFAAIVTLPLGAVAVANAATGHKTSDKGTSTSAKSAPRANAETVSYSSNFSKRYHRHGWTKSTPTPTPTPTPTAPATTTPTTPGTSGGSGTTTPTPTPTPTAPATTTPTTPGSSGNASGGSSSTAGVPAGTSLKASGSVTVSTDGAVVDGLNITGTLTINASNVTVRNTRVTSGAFWTVTIKDSAKNVTLENVTVDSKGMSGSEGSSGIVGPGTFKAVEVTGAENGFVPGSGSLITGSYVHDLNAPGSPHYDGIQIDGGLSNIRVENSTIDMSNHGQTSAVMVDNYFGAISNVVVDGNHLLGGGYTVYADGNFSSTSKITGVKYINNKLGKGYYGYALLRNADVTWSGNVDDKTGKAVAAG